jgi:hypothetical protein
MKITAFCKAILVALIVGTFVVPVSGAEPVAAQRVAALKSHLADNQAFLQQYEWLETTTISLKGEVTSRTLQHCSYDADGSVRKVPFNPVAPEHKRFTKQRDKIIEVKKGELTKYMQEAVNLIHQYIPLNPNGIQAALDEGKLMYGDSDPGKKGQLTIRNFLIRGDYVSLDMELTNNRPLLLKVNSFLDTEGVPAIFSATFESLYGNATFIREAVFYANDLGLKISVQNSDFNKIVP